jgi:hypothetical protein
VKTKRDALKEREAEMLKQFNVKELEERLEMKPWFGPPSPPTDPFPKF